HWSPPLFRTDPLAPGSRDACRTQSGKFPAAGLSKSMQLQLSLPPPLPLRTTAHVGPAPEAYLLDHRQLATWSCLGHWSGLDSSSSSADLRHPIRRRSDPRLPAK